MHLSPYTHLGRRGQGMRKEGRERFFLREIEVVGATATKKIAAAPPPANETTFTLAHPKLYRLAF